MIIKSHAYSCKYASQTGLLIALSVLPCDSHFSVFLILSVVFLFQVFTAPEPDSTREDLQYYEHEVDPKEDWMVKSKKEWWDLLRVPTNPLDLAVVRLGNLERNIERRYLKGPLWNLAEVMRLAPLTSTPEEEETAMNTIRSVKSKMFNLKSNLNLKLKEEWKKNIALYMF